MITVFCPHCAAGYKLDAAKIGPQGRRLKCAKCATVWVATVPEDLPPEAPPPAEPAPEAASSPTPDAPSGPTSAAETASEPSLSPAPDHELPAPEPIAPEVSVDDLVIIRKRGVAGHLRGENIWLATGALVVLAGALAAAGVYWNTLPPAPGAPLRAPVPVAGGTVPAGVTLHHVEGAVVGASGTAVLHVAGEMTNTTAAAVSMPALRLELVGLDGTVRDAAPIPLATPSPRLDAQATVTWAVSLTSPVLSTVRGWRVVFQ